MKLVFGVLSLVAVSMSSAFADQVSLNYINTNNCERARNEVLLLNSASVQVDAVCSEYSYQGYLADNGKRYDYRLYTTVTVPGAATSGATYDMNFIDTNDCVWAQSEINLLNSRSVAVSATCSDYAYQGYTSDNGLSYNYRLYTTITIR